MGEGLASGQSEPFCAEFTAIKKRGAVDGKVACYCQLVDITESRIAVNDHIVAADEFSSVDKGCAVKCHTLVKPESATKVIRPGLGAFIGCSPLCEPRCTIIIYTKTTVTSKPEVYFESAEHLNGTAGIIDSCGLKTCARSYSDLSSLIKLANIASIKSGLYIKTVSCCEIIRGAGAVVDVNVLAFNQGVRCQGYG